MGAFDIVLNPFKGQPLHLDWSRHMPDYHVCHPMTSDACAAAGITSTPLLDKTDKTKPMGAFASTLNPLVGQPEERGASPLLYAAASPELNGESSSSSSHAAHYYAITPTCMYGIFCQPEEHGSSPLLYAAATLQADGRSALLLGMDNAGKGGAFISGVLNALALISNPDRLRERETFTECTACEKLQSSCMILRMRLCGWVI